jgi:hypothetical protein
MSRTVVNSPISPPKTKVEIKTIISVELTIRLLCATIDGLTDKLSAKAIAPRIIPEYQMTRIYLIERPPLNLVHVNTRRAGIKTAMPLATIVEISRTILKTKEDCSS